MQLVFASISAQQQLVKLVKLVEQATPSGDSGWLKTDMAEAKQGIKADTMYTLALLFGGGVVSVMLDGAVIVSTSVAFKVTKLGIRSSRADTTVTGFKAQGLVSSESERGNPLAIWKDASAGKHHAIATSIGSEPEVAGRADTSLVRLSKTSGLAVLDLSMVQPYTMFGQQRYIEGGAGRTFGSVGSNWWCGLWGGQWSMYDGTVHVDAEDNTAQDAQWGLATCRSDGRGNHNFYLDGVDKTRPRLRPSEEAPGKLAFGSDGFVKTEATAAELGEMIVFSIELNPTERLDVATYIQNKTWPQM